MSSANKHSIQESELFNIHNYNLDIENREIYLHSYISDLDTEPGIDYRCANIFEKNIRYLNLLSLEPILVHMHIPGGDWQDCLGIYDAIKFSKAKIIILAYSKAESSSSVLLQAGDLRIMMPNASMLIHYGFVSVDAEQSAASAHIKWNEIESVKMIDIFTDKCMRSQMAKDKNWKRMMAKKHIQSQLANKTDWILTADETVYYGFADGVLGTKEFPNIDHLKTYIKRK
jgi:ATP-dependent protease ClpP protease subunit